jgi:hypothetical protein
MDGFSFVHSARPPWHVQQAHFSGEVRALQLVPSKHTSTFVSLEEPDCHGHDVGGKLNGGGGGKGGGRYGRCGGTEGGDKLQHPSHTLAFSTHWSAATTPASSEHGNVYSDAQSIDPLPTVHFAAQDVGGGGDVGGNGGGGGCDGGCSSPAGGGGEGGGEGGGSVQQPAHMLASQPS